MTASPIFHTGVLLNFSVRHSLYNWSVSAGCFSWPPGEPYKQSGGIHGVMEGH